MYVKNMVKVYPDRLKIFEYRIGYHKKDPNLLPIDEWYDSHQYHQKVVRDFFHSDDVVPAEVTHFEQVPMPHAREYKRFLATQDARMGVMARNELQATIRRLELLEKSMKRTKSNIFDYISCNDFDMFITFSFAHDRYDIDLCKKRLMKWLNNQQIIHKQKGYEKFGYILIPEFHKDKKAIHFHGLFRNYRGEIVKSVNPKTGKQVVQKGKPIFNVKSYELGFTNLSYIVNKEATGRYVTKYVTKDIIELPGQKRYWASRDLKKPEKLYNEDLSNIERSILFEGDVYTVSSASRKT